MQATSLPRERVREFQNEAQRYIQQTPATGPITPDPAPVPRGAVDSLGSGELRLQLAALNVV